MRRIITVALLLYSWTLTGQENQVIPGEIKYRTFVNEPLTLKKGFFVIQSAFSTTIIDQLFNDSGDKEYFTDNLWASGILIFPNINYGLSDQIELELSTSYESTVVRSSSEFTIPSSYYAVIQESRGKRVGLGDISLGVHYQLIPENIAGSGLVSTLRVILPTGKAGIQEQTDTAGLFEVKEGIGTGALGLSGTILYRKSFFPFSTQLFFDYKYGFRGEKVFYAGDVSPSEFQGSSYYSLTANFNIQLNDWIALRQQLFYSQNKRERLLTEEAESTYLLQYTPFVSFQIKSFRVIQAFGLPLKGKNTGADKNFTVILRYIL